MHTQSYRQHLLFLCTGNYYRSRFAEILFNTLAQRSGLPWQADSRGLAIERGIYNVGAISIHALQGLAARDIQVEPDLRLPLQVTASDFQAADRIIALCEIEHRPLMLERYPQWASLVRYWHVDDVHFTAPPEALEAIAQQVRALIEQLALVKYKL